MPAGNVTVNATFQEIDSRMPGENLALNRGSTAVASTNSPWNPGANPANVFDGTRFAGTGEVPHWQAYGSADNAHWVGTDLGAVYELGGALVVFHAGGGAAWDGMTAGVIQVATTLPATFTPGNHDDTGWTVAGTFRNLGRPDTASGADNGWQNVMEFAPGTTGRWVRVKATDPLSNPPAWTAWPRVSSLEIFYQQLPSGLTPDVPHEFFNVTLSPVPANGTVIINPTSTVAGRTITLTPVPNTGFQFDSWVIEPASVVVTNNTFVMPSQHVTVSATFTEIQSLDGVDLAFLRGAHARASSVTRWGATLVPANAFNLNRLPDEGYNMWQADGQDGPARHWIGVDLGAVQELGYVRITFGRSAPGATGGNWEGMTLYDVQVRNTMPEGWDTAPSNGVMAMGDDTGWTTVGQHRGTMNTFTTTGAANTFRNNPDNMPNANVITLNADTSGRFIRIRVAEPIEDVGVLDRPLDDNGDPIPAQWANWPRVSGFEVFNRAGVPD